MGDDVGRAGRSETAVRARDGGRHDRERVTVNSYSGFVVNNVVVCCLFVVIMSLLYKKNLIFC